MAEAQRQLVLDYATPANQTKSGMRRVFLVLAVPSLIVPWVSFVWNVSPLDGVCSNGSDLEIALLAMPFFLAIPLILLKARKQFLGLPTRLEHLIVGGIATCAFGCSCYWLWTGVSALLAGLKSFGSSDFRALVVLGASVTLDLMVIGLLARTVSGRRVVSEAALLAAYLTNAIFCVTVFPEQRDSGWYLTNLVVAIFVADIVHLTVHRGVRDIPSERKPMASEKSTPQVENHQ